MRVWALLMVACGGSSGDAADSAATTETGTVTTGDTGGGSGTGGTTPQSFAGTLTGPTGEPLSAWSLKFCNVTGCRMGETDAAGAFRFDDATTDPYAFEPVPPVGSGYATVLMPLTLDPDETRAVDIEVPMLDAAEPLSATPAEVELGSGLFVTVSTDLDAPFGAEAATEARGVQARVLPAFDDIPGTVIAAWYLDPFNYKSAEGLPFRIENQWFLADGSALHVWVGSYDDFAWLDAGEVVVSGGSLSGTGRLPLLSSVVLVQP